MACTGSLRRLKVASTPPGRGILLQLLYLQQAGLVREGWGLEGKGFRGPALSIHKLFICMMASHHL